MNKIKDKTSKLNIVAAILMFIYSALRWVDVIRTMFAYIDNGMRINFGPVSGMYFLLNAFYAISSLVVAIMLVTRAKNAVLNAGVFLFVITILYGQIATMILNAREGTISPAIYISNIFIMFWHILPFVAMIILITGTASKDVSRAIKFGRIWWLPGALEGVIYVIGFISTVSQITRMMHLSNYMRENALEILYANIVPQVVGVILCVALFLMGRWVAKSAEQPK